MQHALLITVVIDIQQLQIHIDKVMECVSKQSGASRIISNDSLNNANEDKAPKGPLHSADPFLVGKKGPVKTQ